MKIAGDETIKISTGNLLASDLSEIIRNKHNSLKRVANAELVTLFWQIGIELNDCLEKRKISTERKPTIRSISTRLVAQYGSFFTEKNLKKMRSFASLFSELSTIRQFVYLVSWEHILLLLQIKDWKARQFYLKLKIEQGLSVKDLQKQISGGVYYQKIAVKARKTKAAPRVDGNPKNSTSILQIPQLSFELMTLNDMAIQNVFKETVLSSYRTLTEPSKELPKHLIVKSKKPIDLEEMVLEEISQHIEKYSHEQNKWLNANMNLLFWEIGKKFNKEILVNNGDNRRKSIISNASKQLVKEYGKSFTVNQLRAMGRFAARFPDVGIVYLNSLPVKLGTYFGFNIPERCKCYSLLHKISGHKRIKCRPIKKGNFSKNL